MKQQKGFTLIEMMSVVIILGIIMLIAVPRVSDYILSSRKSAYANDVIAYVDSLETNFLSRMYGDYPEEGEILVVPIENIKLERNNTKTSPFGGFKLDYCYIVIVPRTLVGTTETSAFDYYAFFLDQSGYGLNNIIRSELKGSNVLPLGMEAFMSYSQLVGGALLEYNGANYSFTSDRGEAILMSRY